MFRPTETTNVLQKKLKILFRKQDHYSWALLLQEDYLDFSTDNYILEFDVICPDDLFYYYTNRKDNRKDEGWSMEYIGSYGVYGRFKLFLNRNLTQVETIQIKIAFKSQSKYWEFILMPKYTNRSSGIKLTEDKNRIHFNPVEQISFPGEVNAFRIMTSDRIKMKERYEYKIRLWEIMNSGERILNNSISFPQPQSTSIFDRNNTITSYVYY
jgi:hypothetical protein